MPNVKPTGILSPDPATEWSSIVVAESAQDRITRTCDEMINPCNYYKTRPQVIGGPRNEDHFFGNPRKAHFDASGCDQTLSNGHAS